MEVLINKLVWPASEGVIIHSSTLAYCSEKNKKQNKNKELQCTTYVPFLELLLVLPLVHTIGGVVCKTRGAQWAYITCRNVQ